MTRRPVRRKAGTMAADGRASSWTLGLAASLALHAVIVGLLVGGGRSGTTGATDEPETEPIEAADETPTPVLEPTGAAASRPAAPATVLTPAAPASPTRPAPLTPVAGAATGSLADITTNVAGVDAPAAARPAVHVVRQGDTVTKIAAAYGLTPAELARINGRKLSEWNNIWVGQKIKLRK